MIPFPFVDLPPTLLERIITKLDCKSYFRLQISCHKVAEFVRINKNIYVCVEKNSNLKWERGEDGTLQLFVQFRSGIINMTGHYGLRLQLTAPPNYVEESFYKFCDALRSHRITCFSLSMRSRRGHPNYPMEQCKDLIKTLNPAEINMEKQGPNQFEALIHSKALKTLSLSGMDPQNINFVMENCLVNCQTATLSVAGEMLSTIEEVINLILSTCQILRSGLDWGIHDFQLQLGWTESPAFREQLQEKLSNCDLLLAKEAQIGSCGRRFYISMPGETCCEIHRCSPFTTVTYHRTKEPDTPAPLFCIPRIK